MPGRVVSPELEAVLKNRYRSQEQAMERQQKEDQERSLVIEYEQFRMQLAETVFQEMPDAQTALLRRQKIELLRQQDRFQRIAPDMQEREIDAVIFQDIARKEAPPYEKWRLRKQAQQAVLAFANPDASAGGIHCD
jgi:RecA-family ATPase